MTRPALQDLRPWYVAAFAKIEAIFAAFTDEARRIGTDPNLSERGYTTQVLRPKDDASNGVRAQLEVITTAIDTDRQVVDAILNAAPPLMTADEVANLEHMQARVLRSLGDRAVRPEALMQRLHAAIVSADALSARALVELTEDVLAGASVGSGARVGANGAGDAGTVMSQHAELERLRKQAEALWATGERRAALQADEVLTQASDKASFVGISFASRLDRITNDGGSSDAGVGFFGFDHPNPDNFSPTGYGRYSPVDWGPKMFGARF